MTTQEGNKVGGDLAGGSIIKNYYSNKEDFTSRLKELSKIVNNKLPDGLYVPYENRFVDYCSKLLFTSLIEISIKIEVAIDIVNEVPNKIDDEIRKIEKENSSSPHKKYSEYRL